MKLILHLASLLTLLLASVGNCLEPSTGFFPPRYNEGNAGRGAWSVRGKPGTGMGNGLGLEVVTAGVTPALGDTVHGGDLINAEASQSGTPEVSPPRPSDSESTFIPSTATGEASEASRIKSDQNTLTPLSAAPTESLSLTLVIVLLVAVEVLAEH